MSNFPKSGLFIIFDLKKKILKDSCFIYIKYGGTVSDLTITLSTNG